MSTRRDTRPSERFSRLDTDAVAPELQDLRELLAGHDADDVPPGFDERDALSVFAQLDERLERVQVERDSCQVFDHDLADRRLLVRERISFAEDRAVLALLGRVGDGDVEDDDPEDLLREEDGTLRPLEGPPAEAQADDENRGTDGVVAVEVAVRARRGGRHGDACLVETPEPDAESTVVDPATSLLTAAGFRGFAAVRFGVTDDQQPVLLDVTPHAPRWLRVATEAGPNLPYISHEHVTREQRFSADATVGARWVSFADYLPYVADGGEDHLTDSQWMAYITGRYQYAASLTTAAMHGSDTDVTYALLRRELGLS